MQLNTIEFYEASGIWHGEAISTRGQRYKFGYQRGRLLWCDRQVPWQGNGTLWSLLGAMPRQLIIKTVKACVQKRRLRERNHQSC